MTTHIDALARAMASRGGTLAVAESLTSGMLASTVGSGERASEWFAGAVVAYRTPAKESVLGVSPGTDPCSPECARQLATGVRRLMDADVAVSTTGVGGPGAEDGHPPGTVFIGWATRDAEGYRALKVDGEPDEVLRVTVDAALAQLVRLVED